MKIESYKAASDIKSRRYKVHKTSTASGFLFGTCHGARVEAMIDDRVFVFTLSVAEAEKLQKDLGEYIASQGIG